MLRRLIIVMAAVAVLTAAVLHLKAAADFRRDLAGVVALDEEGLDDLHLDLVDLDSTGWIRQYLPEKSAGGYMLALYRRRVPMIIDMNSRIVHVWPYVRAYARARLNHDGTLAVIGTDNLIKEYGWNGKLRWYHRLSVEDDFPHHDLIRLANGNYLILARDNRETQTCYLEEVDRKRRVVWRWRSLDHMDDFPTWNEEHKDPTHFNSIYELPENSYFDAGDERFRPGNLLVSARHLNTIFIIDRSTGAVVWQYSKGLDYQHEATMVPRGEPGEGQIVLFNNGRNGLNGYRRSRVQAVEPISGEIRREFDSRFFYSSVAGTVQTLPGGNWAISSSHGGRVFEMTQTQEVVWEWVPSYMPMRPQRLAYDHCPQLEVLAKPAEKEVILQGDTRPYVDIDLYRFALAGDYTARTVGGHARRLLRSLNECRELLIPPAATMWVEFGIREDRLQGRWIEGQFQITVERQGEAPETVLDTTLNTDSKSPWRGRDLRLGRFSFQKVEMCVSAEVVGEMDNPEEMIAWGNPLIRSPVQHPDVRRSEERISEREQKLREQQLKALGYVN